MTDNQADLSIQSNPNQSGLSASAPTALNENTVASPVGLPQRTVNQTVKVVGEKVQNLIDKVENPANLSARTTFGYKPTETEKKQKEQIWALFEKVWWILVLLVVGLILIFNWPVVSSFYCLLTNCQPPENEVLPTLAPAPAPAVVNSIFSQRAVALTQDFGWLRANFFSKMQYYSAGEVVSGGYTGAKRFYVATQRKADQVFRLYEFYQLSSGEVVLIGGRPNVRLWMQNLQDYYLGQYFADNVRFQDEMFDDFPTTLPVSETMLLYRREVLTDLGPYDCNVHNGAYFDCTYYGQPELALSLSPSAWQRLPALKANLYKDLNFYAHPYSPQERQSQIASNLLPEDYLVASQYIVGGSKVIVQDSTGVNMVYELVFKDQYENYQRQSLNNDLRNLGFYQQELVKYTATQAFADYKNKLFAGEAADLPIGKPNTPVIDYSLPGFVFTNKQFQFAGEKHPQYSFYIGAFSSICSRLVDGKVMQQISTADLEEIGRVAIPQAPLYRLKNSQHPLNNLIYNLKIASPRFEEAAYKQLNQERLLAIQDLDPRDKERIRQGKQELPLPTLADYINSEPLLFILDPWQRPIAIWEADLEFLANCVTIGEDSSIERVRAF